MARSSEHPGFGANEIAAAIVGKSKAKMIANGGAIPHKGEATYTKVEAGYLNGSCPPWVDAVEKVSEIER